MKTRNPVFLMANLGSEVVQLFLFLERGRRELAVSAARRARAIIAELLIHDELQGRTGEIKLLQDIITDALSEKRILEVTRSELEDYFMPFSLRIVRRL